MSYFDIVIAHLLDSALTDCAYIEKAIEDYNNDKITKEELLGKYQAALKSLNRILKDLQ